MKILEKVWLKFKIKALFPLSNFNPEPFTHDNLKSKLQTKNSFVIQWNVRMIFKSQSFHQYPRQIGNVLRMT